MCNTENIIYNYLIALSNLIAIPCAYWHDVKTHYIYSLMLVSLIYHLSETKKGLPGLPFLNRYSYELLIVDRIFGYGGLIIMTVIAYVCDVSNPLWWFYGYIG